MFGCYRKGKSEENMKEKKNAKNIMFGCYIKGKGKEKKY